MSSPPSSFLCPLTRTTMSDPVSDHEGHSFDRATILQWLRSHPGRNPCSKNPLAEKDLVPNIALKKEIDGWKAANLPKQGALLYGVALGMNPQGQPCYRVI